MIETKDFAYIHTSRTGGTFTNTVLRNIFPESYLVSRHLPLSKYKGKHNNFISTVRNPFDWYVSVFHFYQEIKHPLTLGVRGFDNVMRLLLNISGTKRQEHLANYDWTKTPAPNLTNRDFKEYPDNIGFCSWLFERMTGLDTEKVSYLRFENLEADLISTLKEDYDLTIEQEKIILSSPNKNTTVRRPYREYYSDELISLVYEKDSLFFKRFGYEF